MEVEPNSAIINWDDFKSEAQAMADREILLSQFIHDVILSHISFESSMAELLSISFTGLISTATWREIFRTAFISKLRLFFSFLFFF